MKRVLVIATRQIGDVLLTTPLVHAVRQRWPGAHVAVLGFDGTLGMLAGNADVDETIATPARLGWRGFVTLLRRLWRRYDLALVTQHSDRAHLLGFIAARERSGLVPDQGGSNWWKRALLRHAVTVAGDRGEVHVVAEKLALLRPWSPAAAGQTAPRMVPPAPLPLPDALAGQLRAGYVVVHAPSMWDYKQWPLEHWAQLVRALLDEGRQLVLTGSGSARDQQCVAALRGLGQAPALLDASGQLDFRQLAGLLQGAALYVGPDTSVSHLAAACGIPVVAIFGPTNPMRWGPPPCPLPEAEDSRMGFERVRQRQDVGNVTLLQDSLACVPCGRAGCDDHLHSRAECLPRISPVRVLGAIRDRLASVAPAPTLHEESVHAR